MTDKKSERSRFTFYSRPEYYQLLADMISRTRSGQRVAVVTMAFIPSQPVIQRILRELAQAAKRGAEVIVLVDAYSFLIDKGALPGPLMFTKRLPNHMPRSFRDRVKALELVKANGGSYRIINIPAKPLSNPFARRSHIKFAVVNDAIFIGGCNLTTPDHLDLMASWDDAKTANELFGFSRDVLAAGTVRTVLSGSGISLPVDSTTKLLIDAGLPNQSPIFEQAIDLIDSSRHEIFMTCQYFPNNITAQRLMTAVKRGVKVTLLFNHPSKHPVPLNLLHHSVLWVEKMRYPGALFVHQLPRSHTMLHAKLIVADAGSIIGSHNYVRTGVRFGTAETALFSTDKQFGQRAREALLKQITVGQNSGYRKKII